MEHPSTVDVLLLNMKDLRCFDGKNSSTNWGVQKPGNRRWNHLSTVAGFLPSTLCLLKKIGAFARRSCRELHLHIAPWWFLNGRWVLVGLGDCRKELIGWMNMDPYRIHVTLDPISMTMKTQLWRVGEGTFLLQDALFVLLPSCFKRSLRDIKSSGRCPTQVHWEMRMYAGAHRVRKLEPREWWSEWSEWSHQSHGEPNIRYNHSCWWLKSD